MPELGFGHGLGDIVYYAVLFPITIIHFLWFFKIRKANSKNFIAPLIIFFMSTLYFLLEATVWRGPEAPWYFVESNADDESNRIMYEVKSGNETNYIDIVDPKEKYVSELKITVTTSNNKIAFIDSGKLVRPDTLKQTLNKSDYKYIIIDGQNPFATDTISKTMFVKGQIVGMQDTVPVFYISSYWKGNNDR